MGGSASPGLTNFKSLTLILIGLSTVRDGRGEAVNRQISIELMSRADCIHLAVSPFEWRFACWPRFQAAMSVCLRSLMIEEHIE